MSQFKMDFPAGYYKFHKDQVFNFQLNRWYSLDFFRFEDIDGIGNRIKNFQDWKTEMVKLAEVAVLEKRLMNAAFYYRAAEFYTMSEEDPGKEYYYDKFIELFYKAIANDDIEKIQVPFESIFLPVIRMAPINEKKGTILLHGGFDSFLEEWYYMMKYLSDKGFEVIGFEGPGQGNVLIKQGYPLDYRWERPVKAILDFLNIDNASIFGLSMGGWFCLRAAAFESRITNVIASGHAINYFKIAPVIGQWLMQFFIKNFRDYTAKSFVKVMKNGGIKSWQVSNLAHITKKDPLEAFEYSMQLNETNLHSELVKQHVLLLSGRKDHFVPFKMHAMQIQALTNTKSLTDKVFTENDSAHNHCQIGNIKLMLDEIIDWLNQRLA